MFELHLGCEVVDEFVELVLPAAHILLSVALGEESALGDVNFAIRTAYLLPLIPPSPTRDKEPKDLSDLSLTDQIQEVRGSIGQIRVYR